MNRPLGRPQKYLDPLDPASSCFKTFLQNCREIIASSKHHLKNNHTPKNHHFKAAITSNNCSSEATIKPPSAACRRSQVRNLNTINCTCSAREFIIPRPIALSKLPALSHHTQLHFQYDNRYVFIRGTANSWIQRPTRGGSFPPNTPTCYRATRTTKTLYFP